MHITAFIIHGSYGSPYENWFGSVAEELASTGVKAFVPHFPSPRRQDFESWSTILDAYFEAGLVEENPLIIGHSSGVAFACKYMVERQLEVRALVSVAGFNNFWAGDPDFDSINEKFFQSDESLGVIRELAPLRIAYWGDDDPFVPQERFESFAHTIDAEPNVLASAGHVNAAAGYSSFPELAQRFVPSDGR